MSPARLSLAEREALFARFLKKYLKRGFTTVSQTPTTAELYKPARFPQWLFKAQPLYIDIDENGRIYVRSGS